MYTKNPDLPPIQDVTVINGSDESIFPPSDWVRISQDCNAKAGGKYINFTSVTTNLVVRKICQQVLTDHYLYVYTVQYILLCTCNQLVQLAIVRNSIQT